MKITCQSCQAKYTIADEKVLGKIVKIRCKKCSSTIVVNGNDPSGAAAYGDPGASDQPGQGAGGGGDEGWTVNVGDGDQRTMTDAEIVAAYQAGVVGAETFCWKDGMGDWLPLREIDQLFEACNATRMVPQVASPALRSTGRGAPVAQQAPPPAQYEPAAAASNGSSNGGGAAPARRAPGRAPGADLFHGAAQAGGEEEVMTSAPVGAPQAYDEAKPAASTGARNENSVLFSLSALTSKGSERPPAMPGNEASGLIDIRQLSAQMGRTDAKKNSRVDDIMNLSSGGAFNGTLSAPMLAAPAVDQYGPGAGGAATRSAAPEKSKTVIFLALGAAAFVIVAAVGATFMLTHKTDAETAAASASAAATESPSGTTAATAAAATTTAAPEPSAVATDTAAASAPTTTAAATTATTPPAAAPVAAAPPPAAAPRPQAAPAPVHAAAAPVAAAPEGAEFNMGEAKAKLAAAATAAQSCKKGDAAGTGRVIVVFAPSGGAQTATISGPPFEGTPTGACVASRFRGVHVPPFSGSPFSVSKSFTIN